MSVETRAEIPVTIKSKLFENTYVLIFPQLIVKMKVSFISLGVGGGRRQVNKYVYFMGRFIAFSNH